MSVQTDEPSLNLVEVNVARKVASLRRDNQMTLRELGQATGLSEAYLSRVENQRTSINIANLAKLASALGVPIATFFEESEEDRPIAVCRAGKGRKMRFRGRNGPRVSLLAEQKFDKLMEPILVDVNSIGPDVDPMAHLGHEFVYVLSGELHLEIGKEKIRLSEGDSVYFDATLSHILRPIEDIPSEALSIVTSKDFRFHGGISRILDQAHKAT